MNAKKNTQKARLKLPLHVYLGYLLVVTLIFSGVTFSKYIASTSAGDGARVATFGDLELTENDNPDEFIITPGVNIKKNPQVSFGVNEPSEMAVYVFVSVNADKWKFDRATNTYKIMRDDKELLSWSIDERWTQLEEQLENKQVFYCTVPANENIDSVPVIKDGVITVSPHLYASEYSELSSATKSITFKAYAVQMQGFNSAAEAWSAIEVK